MPTERTASATALTRIYLSPGLFGFSSLAGFDYMQHVRGALAERFEQRGRKVETRVADVHPTASIRRRAARLVHLVAETCGEDGGPIHLLGHSTGGLDLRLVASPSSRMGEGTEQQLDWLERLASVTSMNTPHFGTPLATVFATPNGQRLLYAVTAVTMAGLRLGAPPLAVTGALVAGLDLASGWTRIESRLIDGIMDRTLQALDPEPRREARDWMARIQDDQGAVFQLAPESMDLFQGCVEARPGLRYQCTASYAPRSGPRDWLLHLRSPWSAVSAALFHLLYRSTADLQPGYPCAPEDGADELLRSMLGEVPPPEANDGIVPLRSQLWGEPVWIGQADHLDVIGHHGGRKGAGGWLTCGADFRAPAFENLMDRIVEGMLEGEA